MSTFRRVITTDLASSQIVDAVSQYTAERASVPTYRTVATNFDALKKANRSTTGAHILVPSGTTLTVPESFRLTPTTVLRVEHGAYIRVDGTFRMDGVIDAGPYPIFKGNGSIYWVEKAQPILQKWFGILDSDIQRVRTIISNSGGCDWYFHDGVYEISTTISLPYSTRLIGQAPEKTIFVSRVSGGPCIDVTYDTPATVLSHQRNIVSNLQLVGGGLYDTATSDSDEDTNRDEKLYLNYPHGNSAACDSTGGLNVRGVDSKIHNVQAYGFHSGTSGTVGNESTQVKFGIKAHASVGICVTDCTAVFCDIGFEVDDGVEDSITQTYLTRCSAWYNRTHAFKVDRATLCHLDNCMASHNWGAKAVYVTNSKNTTISQLRAEGNGAALTVDSANSDWLSSACIWIDHGSYGDFGATYGTNILGCQIEPAADPTPGSPFSGDEHWERYAVAIRGYSRNVHINGCVLSIGDTPSGALRYAVSIGANCHDTLVESSYFGTSLQDSGYGTMLKNCWPTIHSESDSVNSDHEGTGGDPYTEYVVDGTTRRVNSLSGLNWSSMPGSTPLVKEFGYAESGSQERRRDLGHILHPRAASSAVQYSNAASGTPASSITGNLLLPNGTTNFYSAQHSIDFFRCRPVDQKWELLWHSNTAPIGDLPNAATAPIDSRCVWFVDDDNSTNVDFITQGYHGQVIHLLSRHSGGTTQFNHATGGTGQLRLAGGVAFVMGPYDSISLAYDETNGRWLEIARSVNG